MQIIIDTREREGLWSFGSTEVIHKKLDTGDYSIEGLETLLCIERKKTVSEFAINVAEKRFKDSLERMKSYQYRFVIMEFTINDVLKFPIGSGIPKSKWDKMRITPQYIMYFISQIQVLYGIDVIFAGDRSNASYIAKNIMKRVYEQHGNK